MTDQTPRTDADAIIAQHRPCGPKYEGCYSHFPMPHCRADGMMLPCDVMRLAQARTEVLDRPGILDDSIEGNVQRVDAIRVLELAASSQGYPDINGPSFLRDIEEGGYTLRLTTHEERRRRNNQWGPSR